MERPNIVRALAGGFVATIVATAALLLMWSGNGTVPSQFFGFIGKSLGMIDTGNNTTYMWVTGVLWHLNFGAIIFPHLYVLAFYPMLRGNPVVKGMSWGGILWVFACLFALPLTGYGVFATKTAYPLLVCGSLLIAHLIYGSIFGAVTGQGSEQRSVDLRHEQAA